MASNLHGSFILISTAFFLALRRGSGEDMALWDQVELAHAGAADHHKSVARDLLEFLKDNL